MILGLTFLSFSNSIFALPSNASTAEDKDKTEIAAIKKSLSSQKSALGLDEANDFQVQNHIKDNLGYSHTRFQQTFQGIRVWGGEIITHSDSKGNFGPHTNQLKSGINLNVNPKLSSENALSIVEGDLKPQGPYAVTPSVQLIIYPETKQVVKPEKQNIDENLLNAMDYETKVQHYILAYNVHTELENGAAETKHTDYLIDANSGTIISKWDTLKTIAASGTGNSQWYGQVPLNTNQNGSFYEMRDTTRGTGGTFGNNVTTDLNHGTSGNGTLYSDADNIWGDGNPYGSGTTNSTTGPTGQTAAVDQHHGMANTWDMFKNVFNRKGIDNTGKATYGRMHYSTNYDNAFWSDSTFCMTYGDGAPPTGSFGEADFDTVGHEMAHGVCATTANLVYRSESGGLNESSSDIFGTCAEFYALGAKGEGTVIPDFVGSGAVIANYAMFENSWGHPGEALRYMYCPSKDGRSPNFWYNGIGKLDVHYSSGPMNRAWYFLSHGATKTGDTSTSVNVSGSTGVSNTNFLPDGMTGIGNDKAAKIWYRALSVYLTSNATYADARTACIKAARDLYPDGGVAETAVSNAFRGINVGEASKPSHGKGSK